MTSLGVVSVSLMLPQGIIYYAYVYLVFPGPENFPRPIDIHTTTM